MVQIRLTTALGPQGDACKDLANPSAASLRDSWSLSALQRRALPRAQTGRTRVPVQILDSLTPASCFGQQSRVRLRQVWGWIIPPQTALALLHAVAERFYQQFQATKAKHRFTPI